MKNNRTFLEKLLDGVEVEWKTLDEIFHLKNGYTPSKGVKEYWENGSIPWFRMEDIRENGRVLNTALQKVSESAVKGGKLFPANSIIIATSATIGEHALITIPFLANQRFTVLSLKPEYIDKFNIYFLYHYCFTLDDWCQKNTTMSSFASVDMNGFRKFLIPIPPLSVQTEIVKILDALTTLTSELTSELILRRKQYEYYREKLLSEEELGKVGFEWKCLKHIFNIFAGGDVPKEFYSQHKTQEFNIPILSNGTGNKSLYGWTNKAKINKPSLTISARGTIGWTSYREEPFYPIVRLLVLTPKIELNLKYAYHFMKMIENNYKVPESGIPQLTKPMIEELRIPVPSFSEQQSIASILDKFEILNNSITDGLPLAIEQSQKRYEYYRELLLNFPGKE